MLPPSTDAPAPPGQRRPYCLPALTPIGTIGATTAGPAKDPNKTLDMLFGGDGGFEQPDGDPTS